MSDNGASAFDVQRMPPQALDIEQAVLGAMLMSGEAIDRAGELLDEKCFYHAAHALPFRAMLVLHDRRASVDVLTLADELRRQGALDQVGGIAYLATLAASVATAGNIAHHARIVREKATLRRIIDRTTELQQRAYLQADDATVILQDAEEQLTALQDNAAVVQWQPFRAIYDEALSRLERAATHPELLQGVMTGHPRLDRLTNGFQPGNLVLVAARPSVGKSSMCFGIAHRTASQNKAVAFFSLEMSKVEVTQRLMSLSTGISLQQIRTGKDMHDADWAAITREAGRTADLPLWIDDRGGLNPLQIRAACRRLTHAQPPLALIVIDYLQIMTYHERADSEQEEVSKISRALKALAKEYYVPVIALSQLSRKLEDRSEKRPQLSDLRSSGALEQDADVVLFLHRPDLYERRKTNDPIPPAELILAKQRNGPTGTVEATWDGTCARYIPMAEWYRDEAFDHPNNE